MRTEHRRQSSDRGGGERNHRGSRRAPPRGHDHEVEGSRRHGATIRPDSAAPACDQPPTLDPQPDHTPDHTRRREGTPDSLAQPHTHTQSSVHMPGSGKSRERPGPFGPPTTPDRVCEHTPPSVTGVVAPGEKESLREGGGRQGDRRAIAWRVVVGGRRSGRSIRASSPLLHVRARSAAGTAGRAKLREETSMDSQCQPARRRMRERGSLHGIRIGIP